MKNKKENGVTLIILVISVIVLSILTGMGVSAGLNTLKSTKYTIFQSELGLLQTKINEITEQPESSLIGQPLTTENEAIFNDPEVEQILTAKASR